MRVLPEGCLDIRPVITHRFGADEFEKGFEVMHSGMSGKVVLDWSVSGQLTDTFMHREFREHLGTQLDGIRAAGTYKRERTITTPQGTTVSADGGGPVPDMCANNHLGPAQDPSVKKAAHEALDQWGYGMASVRFICGTQGVRKELEDGLSDFPGTDDTIHCGSGFDANGGLFETLLGPGDAIISDELNHASIIDGVRLCKAKRFRCKNCDMADLAAIPSCPSCRAMRRRPTALRSRCLPGEFMSSDSAIRWCRRASPASAPRSVPPTRVRIRKRRSRHSML